MSKRDCNLKQIACNQNRLHVCNIISTTKIDCVYLKPVKCFDIFSIQGYFRLEKRSVPLEGFARCRVSLILNKANCEYSTQTLFSLPRLHPSAVFSRFNSRLSFRNHLLNRHPFQFIRSTSGRTSRYCRDRQKFVRGTVEMQCSA